MFYTCSEAVKLMLKQKKLFGFCHVGFWHKFQRLSQSRQATSSLSDGRGIELQQLRTLIQSMTTRLRMHTTELRETPQRTCDECSFSGEAFRANMCHVFRLPGTKQLISAFLTWFTNVVTWRQCRPEQHN